MDRNRDGSHETATTRRGLLVASAATLAGVAGCSSRRSGTTGGPLAFHRSVSLETRARFERALDRTESILGRDLDGPVRVRTADPGFDRERRERSRFERVVARATHRVAPPEAFPGSLGTYSPGDPGVITLTDPGELDVRELARELDVEVAEDVLEGYPAEPFLAHELVHAFQDQVVTREPRVTGYDRRRVAEAVTEGTAEYVQARYRHGCSSGAYDPCVTSELGLSVDRLPAWALPSRLPYVNGRVLADRLYHRGGWDSVWLRHRAPPETAWVAMFPDRYPEDDPTPEPVDPGEPAAEEWLVVPTDGIGGRSVARLGVDPLYEKLANLGVAAPTEVALLGDGAPPTAPAFRTPLLEGWRGDGFLAVAHADDPDRIGYRWTVRLATPEGAADLADAVRSGYDDRGTARGDRWELDGEFVAVGRANDAVTFSMSPDREGLDAIRNGA